MYITGKKAIVLFCINMKHFYIFTVVHLNSHSMVPFTGDQSPEWRLSAVIYGAPPWFPVHMACRRRNLLSTSQVWHSRNSPGISGFPWFKDVFTIWPHNHGKTTTKWTIAFVKFDGHNLSLCMVEVLTGKFWSNTM